MSMNQHKENESLTGGGGSPVAPMPVNSEQPVQSDYQSPPASVRSGYGTIETPYVAPNYSWYEDLQRNRPQSNSLSAASIIFISGGMSLARSIGIGRIEDYGTHTQYCWFIAVIIGACISALLAHKMTKFAFNLTACILVFTESIIYIFSAPNTEWIVLARYCDGIAVGLTLIQAILAGSEQSISKFRGRNLGFEQSGLVLGSMLVTIFVTNSKTDSEINLSHGIACLIYGLFALISTFYFTIESPMFYLRKNNETEALNVLGRLQKPYTITNETYELLNENKALLEEDLTRGREENIANSWVPLIKITFLRTLVSLSFSLPLTWGFLLASGLRNLTINPDPFSYVFMRLIGVVISMLTIDKVGRRTISALALLIGSVFLLGVGTLLSSSAEVSKNTLNATIGFLFLYQVLAGIVAPASTCYLGEAFSVSVKPYCILISIIVENIVQIIVCSETTVTSTSNFAYVLAALQFIYALIFYFSIPETKQTTLREALNMFKRTVYIHLQNV